VDWDLHHGNGTQNSFYEDSNVLFISTHQYPHYPGTGGIRETGFGTGEGYTINIPISAGAGDLEYATIFHTIVVPILKSYRPQLIMVSAGFDAHQSDPLGGMALTEDGYEQMVQILMHLAQELCDSRLILALEGGYNLTALRDSVSRILAVMGAYDPSSDTLPFQPSFDLLTPSFKNRLKDIISVQKKFWPDLPSF
jgi:acetoin utilization deacetylase AcuC-like enzyme